MKQSQSPSTGAASAARRTGCSAMSHPKGFVALEMLAGGVSLLVAAVAQGVGDYDISIYRSVTAGLAGICGAYIFLRKVGFTLDRQRLVAIAIGGALGSLFGPIFANWAFFQLEFIPGGNYFIDGAAGMVIGLASTPALAALRDPGPAMAFLVTLLPWFRKSDK